MAGSLQDLHFDNSFVRELPADPEEQNQRRQVMGACYSRVLPTPVAAPSLVALSPEVAELIGLSPDKLDPDEVAAVMAGNQVLKGMDTYAACYGGHQFGSWAGQLGDGRAITLGEVVNAKNERWELQLKGAGATPYSRMGDGRAVMRSSVREFLCSEAMFHLGVPTTRALCLSATGDAIVRDMFYDGNARAEPGAVVCRVAPSFLRFGNFEIFAVRGEHEVLKTLADYAIRTHFPHLGEPSKEVYARWLQETCISTAKMISHWMRVGFVHGVMNTDNMSILGLTIDYGPYGWLEGFEPGWTPNTTDAQGKRYCYGRQAQIAQWNLLRFANALYPIVGEAGALEKALDSYAEVLDETLRDSMAKKLGLDNTPELHEGLVEELMKVLQFIETDMTIFYRNLADLPVNEDADDEALLGPLMAAYYAPGELLDAERERTLRWLRRYTQMVREQNKDPKKRRASMNRVNPKYVLRNYLAQLAIDQAEKGDGSRVLETLEVMRHPYDEQPGKEEYAAKRPEWARNRPGCSMLSCSS
jgi:uncharacterized protein YdiU (UPF0061 family)